MDKKHDLAPGILLYWTEKLKSYSDAEICESLRLFSGEFFPSVDSIAQAIERKREAVTAAATERRTDMYWAEFERNNRDIERFKAEHGGKTPQQVWCEENREFLSKIGRREASDSADTTQSQAGGRVNGRVFVGVEKSSAATVGDEDCVQDGSGGTGDAQ